LLALIGELLTPHDADSWLVLRGRIEKLFVLEEGYKTLIKNRKRHRNNNASFMAIILNSYYWFKIIEDIP